MFKIYVQITYFLNKKTKNTSQKLGCNLNLHLNLGANLGEKIGENLPKIFHLKRKIYLNF